MMKKKKSSSNSQRSCSSSRKSYCSLGLPWQEGNSKAGKYFLWQGLSSVASHSSDLRTIIANHPRETDRSSSESEVDR
jgi:hypothetical protein